MKKFVKYVVTVVVPLMGLTGLFASCAHTPCDNDACYDRSLSSVDPYDDGEVAEWGTEKYEKQREKQIHKEFTK